MRTLIVTAADDNFYPLLHGLLHSLHQWQKRPFTDIAVFDLGLSEANLNWVARAARHIVKPRWDIPIDEAVRTGQPSHRSSTARPFLPRYFPGYDVYVWMDADTWVQERFALDMLIAAAAQGPLAAVPEAHPAYQARPGVIQWRQDRLRRYFGENAAARGRWDYYINSGVFALRADAPHWALWAKWFAAGIEKTRSELICDQSALNHTMWAEDLPLTLLPARCNWMCHLAVPGFDAARRVFCEPNDAASPLGILHLTSIMKNFGVDATASDPLRPRSLRYPGPRPQTTDAAANAGSSVHKGISF